MTLPKYDTMKHCVSSMLCVELIRLVAFVGRKLLNVLLLLHQNSCKLNMDILIYDKANFKKLSKL